MQKKKAKKQTAAKSRPLPPPYDPGYKYFKDIDVTINNQGNHTVTKQINL